MQLQRIKPGMCLLGQRTQSVQCIAEPLQISMPSFTHEAWNDPNIRKIIEKSIIHGNFKNTPELGKAFLEEMDRLCNSNISEDEIYSGLRVFFQSLQRGHDLNSGFSKEREERVQRRINQIRELLGGFKPTSYLDVGCGRGDITRDIQDSFALPDQRVLGLEVVVNDNSKHPVKVLEFDGEKIPLGSDSYDLITLFTVLHHAAQPENLLKDIARVVKPDGYLLVREFDAPNKELKLFNLVMDYMLYEVYNPSADVPMPGNYLGYEEWLEVFKRAGLKVEKITFPEPDNPYKPFMALLKEM